MYTVPVKEMKDHVACGVLPVWEQENECNMKIRNEMDWGNEYGKHDC